MLFFAFPVLVLSMFCMIIHVVYDLCLKPKFLRTKLLKQGIKGPTPTLILGNVPDIQKMECKSNEPLSLDCCSILRPHISQWTKKFGMFMSYLSYIYSFHVQNKHSSLNPVKLTLSLNRTIEYTIHIQIFMTRLPRWGWDNYQSIPIHIQIFMT